MEKRFVALVWLVFRVACPLCAEVEGLIDPLTAPPFPNWKEGGKLEVLPIAFAIQSTLENQWAIHLADTAVFDQEGVLQSSYGAFNPTLSARATGLWQQDRQKIGMKTNLDGREGELDLALTQLGQLGTQYAVGVGVSQEKDPLEAPPFDRTSQSTFFFSITQPLMRDFRYSPETTSLIADSLELQASKWELLQTMSSQVLRSVLDYWELIFAKRLLEIRINTKERLERIAQASKRLIEGGILAESELNQQFAEIFQEKLARTEAEQRLYAAYNALLFSMGQEPCAVGPQPPLLTLDSFPEREGREREWNLEALICLANRFRGDLQAARLRTEANRAQLVSARNGLLPQLDLRFGATVSNHEIGSDGKRLFGGLGGDRPQSDLLAEVRFSYPLGNDEAQGEWKQSRAAASASQISERELFERIRSAIATALRNHYALVEELHYAEQVVKWFEEATQAEMRRVQEGQSTIFVLLDFENRLSNAQIDFVRAHRDYAANLTNLMFLTGVLIEPDEQLTVAHIADVRSIHCFLQRGCS